MHVEGELLPLFEGSMTDAQAASLMASRLWVNILKMPPGCTVWATMANALLLSTLNDH
jgi:hypothetical protein